jgi:hypothetical protein
METMNINVNQSVSKTSNQSNLLNNIFTKNSFLSNCDVDEEKYQNVWRNTQNQISRTLKCSAEEIDTAEFIKYLESENIYVKANGEDGKTVKMFLFSISDSDVLYLSEMNINFETQELSYNLKTTNNSGNFLQKYEEFFLKVIEPLIS